jgi:hypothetical protein
MVTLPLLLFTRTLLSVTLSLCIIVLEWLSAVCVMSRPDRRVCIPPRRLTRVRLSKQLLRKGETQTISASQAKVYYRVGRWSGWLAKMRSVTVNQLLFADTLFCDFCVINMRFTANNFHDGVFFEIGQQAISGLMQRKMFSNVIKSWFTIQ